MLNANETILSDAEKAEILYQAWPESGSDMYKMTGFEKWRTKGLTKADIRAAVRILVNTGRLANVGSGWMRKR